VGRRKAEREQRRGEPVRHLRVSSETMDMAFSSYGRTPIK
jgi:hypothetical protein